MGRTFGLAGIRWSEFWNTDEGKEFFERSKHSSIVTEPELVKEYRLKYNQWYISTNKEKKKEYNRIYHIRRKEEKKEYNRLYNIKQKEEKRKKKRLELFIKLLKEIKKRPEVQKRPKRKIGETQIQYFDRMLSLAKQ